MQHLLYLIGRIRGSGSLVRAVLIKYFLTFRHAVRDRHSAPCSPASVAHPLIILVKHSSNRSKTIYCCLRLLVVVHKAAVGIFHAV